MYFNSYVVFYFVPRTKGKKWGRGMHEPANKPSMVLLQEMVKEVKLNRRKDLAVQLVAARRRREDLEVEINKIYSKMKQTRVLNNNVRRYACRETRRITFIRGHDFHLRQWSIKVLRRLNILFVLSVEHE